LYGTSYISYVKNKEIKPVNKIINWFPYPLCYLMVIFLYGKKFIYCQNDKKYYSKIRFVEQLPPPVISIKNEDKDIKNEIMSFHCSTPIKIVMKFYNWNFNKITITKFDGGIKNKIVEINENETKSIYDII